MKIGVLTFHRTTNYGAVLQAFALQEFLNDIGHDAEVIDYCSEAIAKRYEKNSVLKFLNPRNLRRLILYNSFYRDNRNNFLEFIQTYIRLSFDRYYEDTLNECNDKYELYIVGSDQVWNRKVSGGDLAYFLDFVRDDNKKISYAASFGIEQPSDEFTKWCGSELNKFTNVSVREKSGIGVYKSITGKDCVNVLDPSFLLTRSMWGRIADDSVIQRRRLAKKYVLVYCMMESKSLFAYAQKVANEIKGETVYINERFLKARHVRNLFYVTPQEWLGLFKNAAYIVTNSFHGTAFSIIFQKNFGVELLPFKGGVNLRITDLLETLCLQDRIWESQGIEVKANIDYTEVNDRLETLVIDSKNYIRSVVGKQENVEDVWIWKK